MGQIIITPSIGYSGNPPWIYSVGRSNWPSSTMLWSDLNTGVGTYSFPSQAWVIIDSRGSTYTNEYIQQARTEIALDLTNYGLVTFTSGYIDITPEGSIFNSAMWGNPTQDSLALCSQRETLRSKAASVSDYYEILYGAVLGSEFANRLSLASLTTDVSSRFTLNATAISYLNTVSSKSNLGGYAFFGILFGGVADNVAPTWTSGDMQVQLKNVTIVLNYTSTGSYINVGDVWKEITGGYINVGNSWKSISEIDLNIGDTWKNNS